MANHRSPVSISTFFRIAAAASLVALINLALPYEGVAASSWNGSSPSWASNKSRNSSYLNSADTADSSPVSPFAPGSTNVSLDIGQVFLMGSLTDRFEDNLGGQIHYTYCVSELFGFDSALGYSSHSNGDFSMTTLKIGMRTNLAWYDKIIPYASFGLGFYKPSFRLVEKGQISSISPILFGLHLGPGITLEVTDRMFFGTSLTFHDIFGGTKASPVTGKAVEVGGTYTSFLLNAGVTF